MNLTVHLSDEETTRLGNEIGEAVKQAALDLVAERARDIDYIALRLSTALARATADFVNRLPIPLGINEAKIASDIASAVKPMLEQVIATIANTRTQAEGDRPSL